MSERIRRLVSQQASSLEIFKAACEEGLHTLKEAAIEKVFRDTRTTTEMVRVTGESERRRAARTGAPGDR